MGTTTTRATTAADLEWYSGIGSGRFAYAVDGDGRPVKLSELRMTGLTVAERCGADLLPLRGEENSLTFQTTRDAIVALGLSPKESNR